MELPTDAARGHYFIARAGYDTLADPMTPIGYEEMDLRIEK